MTNNVRFTFSVRYVGVMQLLSLIGPLDLIGTWFSDNQRENTIKKHMFKRDTITSSSINNYPTFNSEHNWEDLCIQFHMQL